MRAMDHAGNQMQTALRPSGRRGTKKVRTGCLTCKRRKVKCDEMRPVCRRCFSTDRVCEGYRPAPNLLSVTLNRSPRSSLEFDTPAEARAFDYYHKRSLNVLSGDMDGEFWGMLVLQLCVYEPAVKHAVLAISGWHEQLELSIQGDLLQQLQQQDQPQQQQQPSNMANESIPLMDYNKALVALQQWKPTTDYNIVPLLVCILFICVEFLRGNYLAAQLHIMQGRKVLAGIDPANSASSEIISRHIVPIYTRLTMACAFFSGRVPEPVPAFLRSAETHMTEFTSLSQARDSLFQLIDEVLIFTFACMPLVYDHLLDPAQMLEQKAKQQEFLSRLDLWNISYTAHLASLNIGNGQPPATALLLQTYYHAAKIWVSTALTSSEIAYDSHINSFTQIIISAAAYINLACGSKNRGVRNFAFETEIIPPLYWVTMKCRHPSLRRTALGLLRREQIRNRQENLWTAREVFAVGKKVIALEEKADSNAEKGDGDDMRETAEPQLMSKNANTFNERFWQEVFTIPRRAYPGVRGLGVVALLEGCPTTIGSLHKMITSIPMDLEPACSPLQDMIESALNTAPEHGEEVLDFDIPLQIFETEASQQDGIPPMRPEVRWNAHQSPFGVPEVKRVNNTVIGPKQDGGTWITHFMEPDPGSVEWKVLRQFARL